MAVSEGEKILIVDDDALVLKSLARVLEREGYQTTTADSGKKAIELVSKENFDLVMSDIRMPELDGIETVEIIKKHYDRHRKLCAFMFITGFAQEIQDQEKLGLKATKILLKPFDIADLLGTVKLELAARPHESE